MVQTLAGLLRARDSVVSHHLVLLHREGMVKRVKSGRYVMYTKDVGVLRKLMDTIKEAAGC